VIDGHSLLADSIVSATALCGTLAAIAVIRARSTPDSLSARFIFALGLVSALLFARLLHWNLRIGFFDVLTMVFAAWVPLAALIVLEGLQRRHAPALVKYGALIGGVLFSLLAIFGSPWGFPVYFLLGFQLLSFAVLYLLALLGSSEGLTAAEQRVLVRVRVALPILVVFLVSDYGVFESVFPIRASGVAILFFCWMAIGRSAATTGRQEAFLAFGVTLLLALVVGSASSLMAAMDWGFGVQVTAMALCTGLLALVLNETARAFAETRRDDVLKALVAADTGGVREFIASVADGSPLQGSTLIDGEALTDFDAVALRAAFVAQPVIGRREATGFADDTRQQLDSLFATYDATHLMVLSNEPLILAAAALPSIGSTSALNTELALVQRMAMLISTQRSQANGAA
jgi:hypothetical protein